MNAVTPMACANCGTPRGAGEYCSTCGQRNRHARLQVRQVLADAWQALADGDLPWWRTVRDLTLHPGRLAAEFVEGHRARYVNPVKYCFVMVTLALALDALMAPDDAVPDRLYIPINLWVLVTVPACAALLRLGFLRGPRNYAEQLAFSLYLAGHLTLAALLVDPLLFGVPDPVPVRFAAALVVALVWITHAGVRFNGVRAEYALVVHTVALGAYTLLAMLGYYFLNYSIHLLFRR